jgi:phage terminase small subunit
MALTSKQEKFCQGVAAGMNNSEAYRSAYDTRKMKPETVQNKAYAMAKRGEIQARIEELREPIIKDCRITLESHLNRLEELARKAVEDGQVSAAVKAEELRGKACGLYVEKREVSQKINVNADFFGIDDE